MAGGQRPRLEQGDMLISITAVLGIIGYVPKNFGSVYINQYTALTRITHIDPDPRWVAHVLANPFGFYRITKPNDGGAKAGLNIPTVKVIQIPKPRLAIQKKLVALLDAANEEITAAKELAAKFHHRKRGLLHVLLTEKTRITTK
jgi:type I restriction enzyme S subunit